MRSKVILFCALFLCSKFVASIPFENEESSQQRAYQPRNWQGNQNTAEQHNGSGFARTQNFNSMTNTAQEFENGQEYNAHQERQHFENQGYNNQASLQSLPSRDRQVDFAQTNERRLDNFPTSKDPLPRMENVPVRVNNPFMSHNWGNRFANSAQSATASATSINEKPLVTVNEPYHAPGQQRIQFRPPGHEQSQQQLINQRQISGSYPVSRDFHNHPIEDKSDNVGHDTLSVSNSGPRIGAVRYVNYNEAPAHSSSLTNSGNNAYLRNPRPYAEHPRYNEPAVVKPETFKHTRDGYFGHHGPINSANIFNDGRVIPTNTGFNNEHIRYTGSSPGSNNHAYNRYQAPIGNIKYFENPINSGSNHPAPLHAYRNDQTPAINSGHADQNGPVAPIEVPTIIDEPDKSRHIYNPVINPENDNQAVHTYNVPAVPIEIPTILEEPENNKHVNTKPDESNTYVPGAPVDVPLILDRPEPGKLEQVPVLYSEQEDDNTYNAPIGTPETYDEANNTRYVKNPVITHESNYPAPIESPEPTKDEKDNSQFIHDNNQDSSIPIDKFIENLSKSGEKYNINSSDREKLKAHLYESKKRFVVIDVASDKVDYINDLQTRVPSNYVVVKKHDKQGGNIPPPFPSQPSNPILEEPESPVGINKDLQLPIGHDYNPLPVKQPPNNNHNDYNSHSKLPNGDDNNPLPVKPTPNNNQNDYNSYPQFPNGDDYNPLPVIQANNNDQYHYNLPHTPLSPPSSGYNPSPQFPTDDDDDDKPLPVKQPPNNSDYNESPILKPQSEKDTNSPSDSENNYYKPPPRPQMSNDNNYNPTYEPQYPNVYDHHNHDKPPHVPRHQYHPFNPTWENKFPGSPSKLHTHVLIPTSTTPPTGIDEKQNQKLHTHVRIPTSTTPAPAIDVEEYKKTYPHVHRPTSTTPAPALDEEEPKQLHILKYVPTSTTSAPEVDQEELKKYLDSHSTHHKQSQSTSTYHGYSNDDNDNLKNNDKSHDHKSFKAHTTSTTTTTESDAFIEEFLESLSEKPEDSDIPCDDDDRDTTPKPLKSDKNHPLSNNTPPLEDDDQIITLSPIELVTDNVRDDSTYHLHHDKMARNDDKSKTITKQQHHQEISNDDKVVSKNKKHDDCDEDTSNKPHHLHHDTLVRNASTSKTSTESHHTLKSSDRNQRDKKGSTKNKKKHDCSDEDSDDDFKEDTKKRKTKAACKDSITITDVPVKPDDNSAAETNSENRDDVHISDSTITGDYLLESSTDALKITVSIPNESDGTVTINVQVPDSTGDEDTPGEDLVVSFASKNSSKTVSKSSKQSTQTTDSQEWDHNKNIVLDFPNAVVLMNRTADKDYLSQLMPNNSSLTVFIIEMPHQNKALVERTKETKIYPNGTCVIEESETTWKNEHDQVPKVVTVRKICNNCDCE